VGRRHTVGRTAGRALEVEEAGRPEGFPVLVHHGTPGSCLLYEPHGALAAELGIRLIGYSRPGYGRSQRLPGRDVAACVDDVHALADELELERFAIWGISGGGPHALACAALCDERLVAVASLASVAPWQADGLDWLAGMGEENHVEFGKALEGESALRPYLEVERESLVGADIAQMIESAATLLGDEDRAALHGPAGDYLLEWGGYGLGSGVDGWVDDDLAFGRPWGFDLAQIERPVLVVHGDDDRFVPSSHGRWLAERIPGVEAWLQSSDGHLTLLDRHMRAVDEWLLARV
jgi:pimeloyl-ACP methyl ester carboxylesterase